MASKAFVAPYSDSRSTFKDGIFKGKVLFCTGGGSGIGKGMTEAMMRHGAHSAIIGRNKERLQSAAKELESKTGSFCLPIQADVREPLSLQQAAAKTVEKYGRIDFVICGAAGNFLAPISGLSEKGFKTVIEIDTLGTYNTVKATLAELRKAHGAYIHISATLHYSGTPYQAHVSAAKAAVDALSKVIAVEEGPFGVRSNVIAPGPILDTEGMDRLSAKGEAGDKLNSLANRIPLLRGGAVKDIENATVFLFSDAASWITGQILPVDGGAEHLRTTQLPYPESVLDPTSVAALIKSRL